MRRGLFGAKFTDAERDTIISALIFYAGSREEPLVWKMLKLARSNRSDSLSDSEICKLAAEIKNV